ncbi:hypothetical protein Lbir_1300 [Legionella birminghamensis]|uniref:Uncharacterized protein n=1 Tax=Legionella birminghamensis TaxID=28083 RepID=A0A378I637_9GAMM|nr:hypothetical protein [Legionella birminghamensis]KTC72525.1 hypothetical protein Lbir_1300 [Legionella birminghamensis]STX30658.1 Uncharacterised protein [Legionella birminghamensis]
MVKKRFGIITREYTNKSKDEDEDKDLDSKKSKKIKMTEKPDTRVRPMDAISPEYLREALKVAGSSNDTLQNSFTGAEMGNMLGNGVPGYIATGTDPELDETAEQFEEANNLNKI